MSDASKSWRRAILSVTGGALFGFLALLYGIPFGYFILFPGSCLLGYWLGSSALIAVVSSGLAGPLLITLLSLVSWEVNNLRVLIGLLSYSGINLFVCLLGWCIGRCIKKRVSSELNANDNPYDSPRAEGSKPPTRKLRTRTLLIVGILLVVIAPAFLPPISISAMRQVRTPTGDLVFRPDGRPLLRHYPAGQFKLNWRGYAVCAIGLICIGWSAARRVRFVYQKTKTGR